MSSKRRLTQALGLVFAASVGSLASCSGGDYAILVRVTGSPADTASLYATAKLGDTYAMKGLDIAPPLPLDMIGIRLPADKTGTLTVEVSALGADQCKSASGTVTVNLDAGRGQEVTVNLTSLSPRRCSLILNQSGEGNVSVTPAGTPCGTGCYDYDKGQTAVLKFNATGKSYGAQAYVTSGGICDGYNDCSINVAKRVTADVKFQPRLCSLSKWCWYHPLPQGNILKGIYGTSVTDIWAVGDGGTAMHYDGQTWSLVPTGTSRFLRGVWSGSPSGAWIVGDAGTVLKWDGSKLSPETSNTAVNLNSVWGSSPTNVYSVGDNGTIIRSSGTGSWRGETSGVTISLTKVTGSGDQNVWAIGVNANVLSSTGSTWSKLAAVSGLSNLNDIFVAGSNDVWVAAGLSSVDCAAGRWDGVMWKSQVTGACSYGARSVWGSGPRDVWIAGGGAKITRYADSDVSKGTVIDILTAGSLKGLEPVYNAAWGPAAGHVYMATSDGNIIRRVLDPASTQLTGPLPFVYSKIGGAGGSDLAVVTGTATTEYFLFGDGTTYSSDGKRVLDGPTVPVTTLFDAWTAPDNGMVVSVGSSGQVYKLNGTSWTSLKATTITAAVYSVGGFSSNDFYVGTSAGNIYRYLNGVFPTSAITGTPFSAAIQTIWGRSANEVWAAGNMGLVVKVNQGSGSSVTNPAPLATNLYAIHGPPSPSTHVWAVGSGGFVMRYNGASWSTFSSGVTTDLNSVYALSETDVLIVGDAGVLLRWDGQKLQQVSGPFGSRNLIKIHSPSPTDIWIVGAGNAIWRYMP